MSLLEYVLKEFLSIVETLEKNDHVEKKRIIIDREYFKCLLEKYPYIKFKDKTRVYKSLNLIIHDKNNYTMPYKDKALKKTVRKVVINYDAYLIIKKYIQKTI